MARPIRFAPPVTNARLPAKSFLLLFMLLFMLQGYRERILLGGAGTSLRCSPLMTVKLS
jgi:hypothetical protein